MVYTTTEEEREAADEVVQPLLDALRNCTPYLRAQFCALAKRWDDDGYELGFNEPSGIAASHRPLDAAGEKTIPVLQGGE